MDLNRDSFEDLIGAYALDACDEDEAAAVDRYIAANPEAYEEAERLRSAAAWLGATGPLVPPPNLRSSLLARIEPTVAATGAAAYGAITDRFEAEARSFAGPDLDTRTYNGLTVRELVAHLDAIDGTFSEELRSPTPNRPFIDANTVVEITDRALEAAVTLPFDVVIDHWDATRRDLLDAAANAPGERTVMGYGVNDALVIRAFEAWVHLDDLRRAAGRAAYVPAAPVLRSMADLSMRVVPYALAVTGRSHPGESAEVVLTGRGGGSWRVPLAPGEHPSGDPDVTLTVDILDWCHRFSDRIDADRVPVTIEGDETAAIDVLVAAPAFAAL
jgi:uncharacterized protein (TIGR03083 family)